MPITVAICDDEKNICNHIMRLVKNQYDDCRTELFDSGEALLAAQKEYDIYFLDIQMPGINGMKVAEQLRERQRMKSSRESMIIFITALKEYMSDAFDVKAFHYLVKPIDENKFKTVFSRAIHDCQKEKEDARKYIVMKNGSMHSKIHVNDIYYVESQNNKVVVNGVDGTFEYYKTLQEIENMLGSRFFRCHRCYLVNMKHIKHYNFNTIWLKNGNEIIMAQKKYPLFIKAYMAFIQSGDAAHG